MSQVDFGIQVLVSTRNSRAATRQLQKDLERTGAAGANAGRRASQGLDQVKTSAINLEKQVLKLAVAFGGIFVVPKIIGLLDTYQQLENRLRVVTETSEQLQSAFKGLADVSERTRSSLRGSVELYSRLALSTKELGMNQRQLLGLTESINQAIIISGASAKEAENGLIQLSQGLASGALRGDELRSVLEQLPRVADVIAESMGVTRGQLRKLGEEGAISAVTILKAFEEAQQTLQEEFAKTQQTLGQALTQLTNEFIKLGNSSGTVKAVTDLLLVSINALAFAIGPLVTTVVLMGATWLMLKARMLLAAAAAAKMAVTTGILGERLKVTNFWANAFGKTLKRHPVLMLGSLILTGALALKGMSKAFEDVGEAAEDAAEPIDQFFVDTRLTALGEDIRRTADLINHYGNAWREAREPQQEFIDLSIITVDGNRTMQEGLAALTTQLVELTRKYNDLASPMSNIIQELREELRLTEMSKEERDEYTKMLAYEQRLARVGIDLRAEHNQSIRAEILSLVRLVAARKQANEEAKKLAAANAKLFTKAWTSAMEKATDATVGFLEKLADMNQRIRDTALEFGSSKLAAEQYRETVGLLDAALGMGLLTQDEYNAALTKLAKDLFPKVGEATDRLRDKVNGFLRSVADMNQRIRDTAQQFGSSKLATEQYRETVELLDAALGMGLLTQDEYNAALTKLAKDLFPKVGEAADDVKSGVDDLSTALWEGFAQTALSNTENAIADFVMRGKGNFKDFVNAVLEDLLRMTVRLMILLPLINALKSAFSIGGGTPEGSEMGLDAYGNSISLDVPGKQNGGSWLVGSGVPAFANGGSFNVGGVGGTDSQLVAFRASPNERVTVTRPEQSIGGNTTVNVSVHNNAPGTEARVEQGENGDYRVIVEQLKGAIAGDISRGGTGLNAALEGRYGLNGAAGIQLG